MASNKNKSTARRKPSTGGPGRTPLVKRVVHVSRELEGLAGAGGIKDVTAGLARASAVAGIHTDVFLPCYPEIIERTDLDLKKVAAFVVPMAYPDQPDRTEKVTLFSHSPSRRLTLYLVRSNRYEFLDEMGGTIPRRGIYQYTASEASALGRISLKGSGYYDYFPMNVLLVKGTLMAMAALGLAPDIVHCHDGHTALLPLIAQASADGFAPRLGYTPTLVTIHNAGLGYHQEIGDLDFAAAICGVEPAVVNGCLLNGSFDPLLAGALYGTAINAVSENYARELQETGQDSLTGWLGHALGGRGITLHGVTNGVDAALYNPRENERLGTAAPFWPAGNDLDGKEVCKQKLLEELAAGKAPKGITLYGKATYTPDTPLLSFVGRLEFQKGYDTLVTALRELFDKDDKVQLLGLGSGADTIERDFIRLAGDFPGRVCLALGYNGQLANQVYAAGDFCLVPSRYEPCGLTDYFAQLMGNVPIVHRVGGLVKTLDGRFGYSYLGGAPELLTAIERALRAYRRTRTTALRKIQVQAAEHVRASCSWDQVLVKKYIPLYRQTIRSTRPVLP
jgi:starch synthase